MDPKILPTTFEKKKNHGDAKATFYPYIFLYCITVKGIYVRMNSVLKRSFAGNSARFSFLSVSLYGTREKKNTGVCQGEIFLQFLFMVR